MDMGNVISIVFTGLIIVFIALIILIVFVYVMGKILGIKTNKPTKTKGDNNKTKKETVLNTTSKPVIEDGISDEVIAVISAAVAAMSDSNSGTTYALRGIKRSSNAGRRPVWCFAGIQENTRAF